MPWATQPETISRRDMIAAILATGVALTVYHGDALALAAQGKINIALSVIKSTRFSETRSRSMLRIGAASFLDAAVISSGIFSLTKARMMLPGV
jgi:hypothetical protein